MTRNSDTFQLRPASPADVPDIAACAVAAYRPYVDRIGIEPAPMKADYAAIIATQQVWVASVADAVIGFVVLVVSHEQFWLDNLAVEPPYRGKRIGTALIRHAEGQARRQGHRVLYLYTHAAMTENRTLYARYGYREYDRRVVDGYDRVFMCKDLAS